MPSRRKTMRPITSPASAVSTAAAAIPAAIGRPSLVVRIAVVYAPSAMNPTEPREEIPAWNTTKTLSTSRHVMSVTSMKNWLALSHSSTDNDLLLEQSGGPDQQHRGHEHVGEAVAEVRGEVPRQHDLPDA